MVRGYQVTFCGPPHLIPAVFFIPLCAHQSLRLVNWVSR